MDSCGEQMFINVNEFNLHSLIIRSHVLPKSDPSPWHEFWSNAWRVGGGGVDVVTHGIDG